MLRIRVSIPVVLGLIAAGIVGIASPAAAVSVTQPNIVNAVPASYTPDVNNGIVYAINQVANTVYMGGTFTSVSLHGSSTAVSDNYVAAFTSGTGALVSSFVPQLNGAVETIIPGPAANEVYVGGDFTTADGVTTHIALLNTSDGSMVSTWKPSGQNGIVQKLVLADGMLFAGGSFTSVGGAAHGALVALNPTTGKVLPYVGLSFTGHHNYGVNCSGAGCSNGTVGIKSMDIDPSGTHLVAIGNFTNVSGSARDQAALIDLGATSATVDPNWSTAAYSAACFDGAFDSYVRGVEFSPDGAYFVVVATGGSGTNSDGTNSSCDTAARFDTSNTGANVRPIWVDYTGQDTLLSVAITGGVVYVGGHQRWLNNSMGHDNPGAGAIARPGIAALNPLSGVPFSWNPGRNPRGAGAYALFASSTGVYVGSDTDYIGDHTYLHKKIAFFPVTGGEALPSDATPTLPGRVYTAGAFSSTANSNVLYRVDAGGPTIPAIDSGPDWQGDLTDPSQHRNAGSNTASYGAVANVDSTVPSTTPSAIFDSERWDPGSNGDGGEMHWAFPVPAGDTVDVRLYFANRYTGTSGVGQRVFDVAVDGQTFLNAFDIVKAAGDQTGTMRSDTVTSDGEVTIDLSHEVENPLIDGIEIVKDSGPTSFTPPVPIYRVNAGGEKLAATGGAAADWLADNVATVGTGTSVRSGSANASFWSEPWTGTLNSSVPPSTPANLFGSEDWDSGSSSDSSDLGYSFPVAAGTPVTVKMFFANNCGCTSSPGQRVFNVLVDGQPVPSLTNYDIVADVGNDVGTMKSVDVTAPASGLVTVAFTHGSSDNPLINGIEVDQDGATPAAPVTNVDRFSYRHFDGTTAGAEQQLTTGISWGSIRGAFTANGEIFYGKTDGNLYERTFDGTTFGSEVELDPWNDPRWDNVQTGSGQTYQGTASTFTTEIPSVTSMFFTNGRLYYTLAGDPVMHWRWFEPESGIVGSDEFSVSDGNNWSDVAGAFLAGNTLYYADKATGALSSIGWSGTQPSGSPTVVDGSQNWASRGIFMLADATNPNQPPVAAFTATCSTTSTACTFDASASHDPDGSIAGYDWTFGNNPVEHHSGATAFSHDFGTAGHYSVSLTVTDNDGLSTTKTQQVVVGQTTPVPGFGGATTACGPGTGACGTSATTNVAVPSSTVAGDALLMFVSWPTSGTVTASAPAGWHLLATNVSSPLESDVYYRAASASDIGGTVPVTFSGKTHNAVTLADYHGADPNTIEAFGKSVDSSTTTHTTPTVTVATAGSLAASYWADKSSTTTAWTAPASVTPRATFFDTGGGYTTSLLADSNTTVPSGSYGGKAATTNAASGKGAEWTIILAPAGSTNAPPVASFTSNCTNLSCTFDASGSSDPDGTVATYAWNFGDGHTAAAGASRTASNVYPAAGTYQVTLTVTDNNNATGTLTKSVAVSGPIQNIAFEGASKYDNTGSSGTVTIPAATASGDTLLLFESHASTTITATTPAGWTLLGSTSSNNLRSAVYEKTAVASDASSPVAVTFSASVKAEVTVADYTDTAGSPIEAALSSTAASTTSHSTLGVSGLNSGSWVVSFWTDKSTTTSSWTLPVAVTQRSVVFGSGTAAVSAALADSGAGASGSSAQWTIALSPAP
jgi:hypothetical protein